MSRDLRFAFVTPFFGGDLDPSTFEPATLMGWVDDYEEGLVTMPRTKDGPRSCRLELPADADSLRKVRNRWGRVEPYSTFIYADYDIDESPFIGPILSGELDTETGKFVLNASDYSVKMQKHFFRRGDSPLTGDKGPIIVGPSGIEDCLAAARNTIGQDADGTPPLGIASVATTVADSSLTFQVQRSDEVWQTAISIQAVRVLEFWLQPRRWDPTIPLYYDLHMDSYPRNDDRSINLWSGSGKNNVEKVNWKPGGDLTTHVHVVDKSGYRRTRANTGARSRYGVWVRWEPFDHVVTRDANGNAVLDAIGDTILEAYSSPLQNADVVLNADSPKWLDDFDIGSHAFLFLDKGFAHDHNVIGADEFYITEVRLRKTRGVPGTQEEISLLPWIDDSNFSTEDSGG